VALETFLARYHECTEPPPAPQPAQESPYASYLSELILPAETPQRAKAPAIGADEQPMQKSYLSASPSEIEVAPMADSVGQVLPPVTDPSKPAPKRPRHPEPIDIPEPELDEEAEDAPRRNWRRAAAIVVVVMAIAGAGLFATRSRRTPAPIGASVGTLVVESNPPGAKVIVDGESRGVTPVNLTLKAGAHVVELHGAGEPRVIPLTVAAGAQVSQYIELPKNGGVPAMGQLQVTTEPAGARVTVDGQPRGTSPMTITDLSPGEHEVLLESDLGPVRQRVTIEAATTASLVVPMTAPANAPLSGWVSISAPVEVQLFEQGRLLGTSQSDRIMVAAGRHDIEIVNDTLGYREMRTVQVPPGRVAPMVVELPKGTIALNAIPWAEVWIDGERVGETPIGNLAVAIGPHEIVFRNPELGEQRHAITVTAAGPARLSVDLRKQ
jgi:hypothetical protein